MANDLIILGIFEVIIVDAIVTGETVSKCIFFFFVCRDGVSIWLIELGERFTPSPPVDLRKDMELPRQLTLLFYDVGYPLTPGWLKR